jgi:hypothetical protein
VAAAATTRASFEVNAALMAEEDSFTSKAACNDTVEADLTENIFYTEFVICDHRLYNTGSEFVMKPTSR